MEEIKVSVNSWGAGRSLTLSWIDPITGKRKTRSAKTKDWRTAERLAGKLAEELEAGTVSPSRITWTEFEQRYTDEKLATLAPSTRESGRGSLRHVQRVLGIEYLAKLTPAAMSKAASVWRKEGMKDTTISHHLRHVKAATRWAEKLGLMSKAPAIEMPKRAKGQSQAKSRPITTEEYERMLAVVPKVRPQDSSVWIHYLTGLWLSGLRRGEAARLTWDQDEAFCVHLGEKRPVFIIRADGQKSGRAETCPMAPDFAVMAVADPRGRADGPGVPADRGAESTACRSPGRPDYREDRESRRGQGRDQDEAGRRDGEGRGSLRLRGLPFLPAGFRFQVGPPGGSRLF